MADKIETKFEEISKSERAQRNLRIPLAGLEFIGLGKAKKVVKGGKEVIRDITQKGVDDISDFKYKADDIVTKTKDDVIGIKDKAIKEVLPPKTKESIIKEIDDYLKSKKTFINNLNNDKYKNAKINEKLSDPDVFAGLKLEDGKLVPDEAIQTLRSRVDRAMEGKTEGVKIADETLESFNKKELINEIDNNLPSIAPEELRKLKNRIAKQIENLPEKIKPSRMDELRSQFRKSGVDAKGIQKPDSHFKVLEDATRNLIFKKLDELPGVKGEFADVSSFVKENLNTIDFLDKVLRGQIVSSGKMTKLLSQISGIITGGFVAGPFGSVFGGVAGNKIAEILSNKQLGNALKKEELINLTRGTPEAIKKVDEILKNIPKNKSLPETKQKLLKEGVIYLPDQRLDKFKYNVTQKATTKPIMKSIDDKLVNDIESISKKGEIVKDTTKKPVLPRVKETPKKEPLKKAETKEPDISKERKIPPKRTVKEKEIPEAPEREVIQKDKLPKSKEVERTLLNNPDKAETLLREYGKIKGISEKLIEETIATIKKGGKLVGEQLRLFNDMMREGSKEFKKLLSDAVKDERGFAKLPGGKADNITTQIKKAKAEGKSFEEFMSEQDIVYHGTGEKFDEFRLQGSKNLGPNAIFFSQQKEVAEYYARGKAPNIQEAVIKTKNIFDYQNKKDVDKLIDYIKTKKPDEVIGGETDFTIEEIIEDIKNGKFDVLETETIQNFIKKEGYDSFKLQDYTGGEAIGVFDPTIIQTESQLKQIWEEANKAKLPKKTTNKIFKGGTKEKIENLIATEKVSDQKAERAYTKINEAIDAGREPRKPIKIVTLSNGEKYIADGNSTFTALKKNGYKDVQVKEADKVEDMGKIVKKDKDTKEQIKIKANMTKEQRDNFLRLKKHTGEVYPIFEEGVESVKDTLSRKKGIDIGVLGPNRKGDFRTIEKVITEEKGDFSEIKDFNRASFVVNNYENTREIVDTIKERFKVVGLKNRTTQKWAERLDGYRDLLINVEMPNGTQAEIQILTPKMAASKEKVHKWFEQSRTLKAKRDDVGLTPAENKKLKKAINEQWKEYKPAWEKTIKNVDNKTIKEIENIEEIKNAGYELPKDMGPKRLVRRR